MVYDWTGNETGLKNRRLLAMRIGAALFLICLSIAIVAIKLT